MAFRHDVVARLTHRIAASPELFGALDGTSDEPALDLHSVHHLLKVVNGTPQTGFRPELPVNRATRRSSCRLSLRSPTARRSTRIGGGTLRKETP